MGSHWPFGSGGFAGTYLPVKRRSSFSSRCTSRSSCFHKGHGQLLLWRWTYVINDARIGCYGMVFLEADRSMAGGGECS